MNNHQNIGTSEIRETVESIKTVILQGQYEAWQMLDSNSSVATDELTNIDIFHTLQIPITKDFPIEDFE